MGKEMERVNLKDALNGLQDELDVYDFEGGSEELEDEEAMSDEEVEDYASETMDDLMALKDAIDEAIEACEDVFEGGFR